jgi:DNA-3-methyladenine glycosylase
MKILARSFYERDTVLVAQELIGKILHRTIDGHEMSGMIVETEAYKGNDPACHAFRGKTERTKALFEPAGHAYIYFTYGNHYCLNIVAHDGSHAGGILIRALEPLTGIEMMQKKRSTHTVTSLCSGPGKITQALSINKSDYGTDITKRNGIFVTDHKLKKNELVIATPRIGISKAQDYLWRFCLDGSIFVSKR